MTQARYIFEGAARERERARLLALEAIFDPPSQRWLESTGDWSGRRCLEVGAGAGSIAAWMQQRSQPGGSVVALDTELTFLEHLRSTLSLLQGDAVSAALPERDFDVAHARYVLVHNAASGAIVDTMLRCLKPGGFILLEEPDFAAAQSFTGEPRLRQAFENVRRAVLATFTRRGLDPRLGARVPEMLEQRGVELVALECDARIECGGSELASMMRLSSEQLADKYLETGCASGEDLAAYARFAGDPRCSAIYYTTLRALGRRRAE